MRARAAWWAVTASAMCPAWTSSCARAAQYGWNEVAGPVTGWRAASPASAPSTQANTDDLVVIAAPLADGAHHVPDAATPRPAVPLRRPAVAPSTAAFT